jgi:hypothetical protein
LFKEDTKLWVLLVVNIYLVVSLGLRYFNKLFTFFYTKYYNNLKYNHKLLFFLKIFFERNNKFNANFTILGNTYRNSKWSNLSISNIKISHINNLTWYFYLVIFSLILIFFFNRYSMLSYYNIYSIYSLFF